MSEPLRRFRLQRAVVAGAAPELAPAELEHALRVLRLAAGDRFEGLDGAGGAFEIEVERVERRGLALRLVRELAREPEPGQSGAALPWIEVAASLPKGARAEELVGRLTQLGVARVVPLLCARSAEQARGASDGRRARLERLADEALKQSGRRWALEIAAEQGLDELCARAAAERILLSPRATERCFDWTAAASSAGRTWSRERPLCLVAGPEGGFTDAEGASLRASGARELWLGPHVLRIETACEAAAAVLMAGLARPRA